MMRFRGKLDDAQLLASTDSDPQAFGVFYERYEALVVGYLRRRVKDPETAADLTAEVFAAAFAAAPRYCPIEPTAVPWLTTMAHNTLTSSVRRGRVEEDARRRVGMLHEIWSSPA